MPRYQAAGALSAMLLVFACGTQTKVSGSDDGPLTLRLGYFPNLTHAAVLIGLDKGYFTSALGASVKVETHTFNGGGDAVTAMVSGAIDATFMGPNPTTNALAQSHGQAGRGVAGATSGGGLL